MGAFTIRNTLQPGDLSQVALFHARIYYRELGFGIGFEAYVMESLVEFYRQYDPDFDKVWIVESEGRMVGFLLLMHRPNNQAQLRYFVLEEAFRGKGIGKKLVQEWMDFYQEKGYQGAYLYTTSGLDSAAYLYESMGFRKVFENASEDFGVPLHEIRYELY